MSSEAASNMSKPDIEGAEKVVPKGMVVADATYDSDVMDDQEDDIYGYEAISTVPSASLASTVPPDGLAGHASRLAGTTPRQADPADRTDQTNVATQVLPGLMNVRDDGSPILEEPGVKIKEEMDVDIKEETVVKTAEKINTMRESSLISGEVAEVVGTSVFALPGLGLIKTEPSHSTPSVAPPSEKEASVRSDGAENDFIRVAQANKSDPNAEFELDSNPESSGDSDSNSSSDSSDSSSDGDDDYTMLDPAEQARILMREEGGEETQTVGKHGPRTQNEQLEEFTKPDTVVTAQMKITELGHVQHMVDNLIIICGNTTGEYRVLESGSLVCLEDRQVVGVVKEPMGPVHGPLYSVGLPTTTDAAEAGVTKGTKIFYVEEHSTYVFTQPLKAVKGSDASNIHDEEVQGNEIEFSDDEAEAEYKRSLKQAKKNARGEITRVQASQAPQKPNPPLASYSGPLDYDDEGGDDFYTPLARPDDYSAVVGQQAASHQENWKPSVSRGGRGAPNRDRGGRGRGDQRQSRGGRPSASIQSSDSSRDGQRNHHPYQRNYRRGEGQSSPRQESQLGGGGYTSGYGSNVSQSPVANGRSIPAPFMPALQSPNTQLPMSYPTSLPPAPVYPAPAGSQLPAGAFINPNFFRTQQQSPPQQNAQQQWAHPSQQHVQSQQVPQSGQNGWDMQLFLSQLGQVQGSPYNQPAGANNAYGTAQEQLDILKRFSKSPP